MFVLTKVDVSNIHDEKFGRPQRSQFQDTLCKPLYIMVFIPIQSLSYQVSHESQHTPAVFQVTALLQEPQGYLSVLVLDLVQEHMSLLTIWHKDIITLANLVLIFFAVHV